MDWTKLPRITSHCRALKNKGEDIYTKHVTQNCQLAASLVAYCLSTWNGTFPGICWAIGPSVAMNLAGGGRVVPVMGKKRRCQSEEGPCKETMHWAKFERFYTHKTG
jgi:hypothetical protein